MNLKDVLAAKGPRVVTVPARSSVADAIRTMHAEKIGAVIVPGAAGCPAIGDLVKVKLSVAAEEAQALRVHRFLSGQSSLMPPSTISSAPRTNDESGLARKSAALAISSAVAKRFIGTCSRMLVSMSARASGARPSLP
jgi:hypothetical protein